MYLAEMFGEKDFRKWIKKQKVFLNFPTGTGKTTLILDCFLSFCRREGHKVLILSNRRLLDRQYEFDLAERYTSFSTMEEDVTLLTYQQLARKLREQKSLKSFLEEYSVVVLDECHFFYSDATFNSFDTYVLLQVLVYESFFKTMIFMTATGREVRKLLYQVFEKVRTKIDQENLGRIDLEGYMLGVFDYDYESCMNYDHITCCFAEDVETLCEKIVCCEGKSIIFIDDKNLASDFREKLVKTEKVSSKDIFILNSEILETQSDNSVIKTMTLNNKLGTKVLITTSVLDNGVSIHDEDVANIIISTESRISFLQMIGRIRTEKTKTCNLFIFPRTKMYYEKRVAQYQEKMRLFDFIEMKIAKGEGLDLLFSVWHETGDEVEFLKNSTVITTDNWEIFSDNFEPIRIKYHGFLIAVNQFAREKTGDTLLAEKQFLKLSYNSPYDVARHQIGWIKKRPDELIICESVYREQLETKLREELIAIQNFALKEFSEKKVQIAKRYFKTLFPQIVFKGASVENKKFEEVCNKYGMQLTITTEKDGKNRYSVNIKE